MTPGTWKHQRNAETSGNTLVLTTEDFRHHPAEVEVALLEINLAMQGLMNAQIKQGLSGVANLVELASHGELLLASFALAKVPFLRGGVASGTGWNLEHVVVFAENILRAHVSRDPGFCELVLLGLGASPHALGVVLERARVLLGECWWPLLQAPESGNDALAVRSFVALREQRRLLEFRMLVCEIPRALLVRKPGVGQEKSVKATLLGSRRAWKGALAGRKSSSATSGGPRRAYGSRRPC